MITQIILGLCILITVLWVMFGKLSHKFHFLYWRRVFVVFLLIVVMVASSYAPIGVREVQDISNRDFLFLTDITYSMNAKDSRDGKPRLEVAKEDILKIAQDNIGARYGISTIDISPGTYLPMTSSLADLEVASQTLFTKSYLTSRQKSPSFKESLEKINKYLEENKKVDASREVVLIVLTDAEISNKSEKEEDVLAELQKTRKLIGGSMVIAYGSDGGATMPVIDYNYISRERSEETGSYSEAFGELPDGGQGIITTKRDQEFGRRIAKTLNGSYVASENVGEIQNTIAKESRQAFVKKTQSADSQAIRQSILYTAFALILLLWLSFIEILSKREWLRKIRLKRGNNHVA